MFVHPPDASVPRIAQPLSLDVVRSEPLKFLAEQTARFGDLFAYELEGFSAVFLGRPAYVKHILQTNAHNYVKTGTPDLMMLKPMLGEGLMTSEGDSWAEQRRVVQPAFHRERIDLMIADIARLTDEMCTGWVSGGGSDTAIDLEGEMSRLTLKVIARVLFGFELSIYSTDFAGAVATMNELMAHFDPTNRRLLASFRDAQMTIARITQSILDSRRKQDAAGDDLLSMLIAARHADGSSLTDDQIRDQIYTFLMAGHETTAKSLTWALYLIDQHPEFRAALRTEARSALSSTPTAAEVERLELTWMLLQESMRLYPPVWLMSRIAVADDSIDGYRIPAGTLVVVSPFIMHRDTRYWMDPQRFDPQRFSPSRAPQVVDYVYFPFSGGPRACIGRRLATIEAKIVLASIARHHTLHLLPGHRVEPEALVTLRPKYGMPMRVRVVS